MMSYFVAVFLLLSCTDVKGYKISRTKRIKMGAPLQEVKSRMEYHATQRDPSYEHVCSLYWKSKSIGNSRSFEYKGAKFLQLVCRINYLEYKIKQRLEQHPAFSEKKERLLLDPIKSNRVGVKELDDGHVHIQKILDSSENIKSKEIIFEQHPMLIKKERLQQEILSDLINSDPVWNGKYYNVEMNDESIPVQQDHHKSAELRQARMELLKNGIRAHFVETNKT